MSDIIMESIIEKSVPSSKKVHIAGDVSATNLLMDVFDAESGETYVKIMYSGQDINDFGEVIESLQTIGGYIADSIENIVLCPAGPLNPDGTVQMTNAPFIIDAKVLPGTVAIINDYAAKGYAVAEYGLKGKLDSVALLHLDGTEGERVDQAKIAILGAGTGLGCGRLHWDEQAGLYLPPDSEGGHTFAAVDVDDEFEVSVMRELKGRYDGNMVHYEGICSGNHLPIVFDAVMAATGEKPTDIETYNSFTKVREKIKHMAQKAKEEPDSLYARTMNFMWKMYGRALRNKAVHENARGGLWLGGGMVRKDIYRGGQKDKNIERLIMTQFDRGPSHSEWVNKIPLRAIIDPEDGLKGSKVVAVTPFYMNRERYAA
jgi:glucokinase